MRNNETGEFELVVGNRQIMSGFFIVVLLFAVGVAMGYFLGQNSPRSAKLADAAAPTTTSAAQTDSRPQPAAPAPAPAQSQPVETAQQPPAAPPETQPSPTTQPVRDSGVPAPVTASAPPPPATLPEAPTGTYWQVMAVGRSDAEVVMRTLQNKGFPSLVSPGTKGLTRVLVGPYPDRPALGRAKTDLEAAGFTNLVRFASEQDRK